MSDTPSPDRSSIGSAYFRAMHVRFDPPPHVFEDELSLRLVDPEGTMTPPPGMEPEVTGPLRASIVARARFIEDLVAERAAAGVSQYVILGAGLDTFAQRQAGLASRLKVFEVDRPMPQAWKRQRLVELGFGVPAWLRLVPVDFEAGDGWWDALLEAGYDRGGPAVVACTGVSMYLTREANMALLRECARLAPGSTLVLSFGIAEPVGAGMKTVFTREEIHGLAVEAGFKAVELVSADQLTARYLANRSDGLRATSFQALLIAVT
jgi:methyltransferase (TIGR00027 family)